MLMEKFFKFKKLLTLLIVFFWVACVDAQTLLFEGKYHYPGVVSNPLMGSRTYLSPFDCYVKVYSDRVSIESGSGTETWPLKRVLEDGTTREYALNNGMLFTAYPNSHRIYFSVNSYYGAELQNYNPPATVQKNNPGNYSQSIPIVPQSTTPTPSQAPICYKCNGVGHYYINGVYNTCSQCGGGGRDWNSPH